MNGGGVGRRLVYGGGVRRSCLGFACKWPRLVNGGGIRCLLVYGGGVGRSGRGFACERPWLVYGGGVGWYMAVALGSRVVALLVNGRGW